MQKDELIQLHMFLVQIKRYLESKGECRQQSDIFAEYDQLHVQPQQVFKSKKEQMVALFELCRGLTQVLFPEENEEYKRMSMRLQHICSKNRLKQS